MRNRLLLFGPLAAVLLALGITGLALMVPGYSHVRQTVSEIGEIGSPAQIPFAVMLCIVALCVAIFALGLREISIAAGHSKVAAYMTGFMAVSAAGVGIFAFPHPLHNVFGQSELIGYQAPLLLALTWQRDKRASGLVAFSWTMFAAIWIAIALNLAPLVPQVWATLKPFHGVVQRLLFAAWFIWCAGVGITAYRRDWRAA